MSGGVTVSYRGASLGTAKQRRTKEWKIEMDQRVAQASFRAVQRVALEFLDKVKAAAVEQDIPMGSNSKSIVPLLDALNYNRAVQITESGPGALNLHVRIKPESDTGFDYFHVLEYGTDGLTRMPLYYNKDRRIRNEQGRFEAPGQGFPFGTRTKKGWFSAVARAHGLQRISEKFPDEDDVGLEYLREEDDKTAAKMPLDRFKRYIVPETEPEDRVAATATTVTIRGGRTTVSSGGSTRVLTPIGEWALAKGILGDLIGRHVNAVFVVHKHSFFRPVKNEWSRGGYWRRRYKRYFKEELGRKAVTNVQVSTSA